MNDLDDDFDSDGSTSLSSHSGDDARWSEGGGDIDDGASSGGHEHDADSDDAGHQREYAAGDDSSSDDSGSSGGEAKQKRNRAETNRVLETTTDGGMRIQISDAVPDEMVDVAQFQTLVLSVRVRRLTTPVVTRSVHVSPNLVFQILRPFGFPKRVLIFPPKQVLGASTAYGEITRGVVQFDSVSARNACLAAFGTAGSTSPGPTLDLSTATCEVHLGGDSPDVFSVTLAAVAEKKVFATSNTPVSMLITGAVIQHLGPRCDTHPLAV